MEHTRNQPILLIGAGPGAVKTVAQVPRAAQGLCVRVAGPFGLLTAGGPAGRIRMSSCSWLSEMRVPEIGSQTNGVAAGSEEVLFKSLCSLLRRLQVGEERPDGGRGGRTHIHAYVVIDLAAADIVPFTVQLVKLLRRAGPSIEMTGLALTGRTVETGTSPEPTWGGPFRELVADLEKMHLLQRLYILDGEDTNGTWLRDPEQMYRIGAEFILHHGMSPYRHSLRRREKTRMSLNEPFLDFCGSVMCRRFSWDSSVVAREVAATLARDSTIQEPDQDALGQERSEVLDRLAQRLVEDISSAYESVESPTETPSPAATGLCPHETASAAVERTLNEVCSTQPAMSVRWFLKGLRPRLDALMTVSRLRARWEARFRAARALHQQAEDTYTPMKEWQRLPGVEWRAPTEPFMAQSPTVVVSNPVPREYSFLAIGLGAVGMGMIALGAWRGQELAMIAGGMLAIWVSLLTVLPVRWVERPRALVPHDAKTAQEPSACDYHKRMPQINVALSLILLVVGAGCLAWTIWAGIAALWSGAFSVIGGLTAGVLIRRSTMKAPRPRKVPGEEEVPDLASPWDRRWYLAGLISLTVAWISLCLGSDVTTGASSAVGLLAGLGAIWLGFALAQFPRRGTAKLICTIPQMPQKPVELDEVVAQGPQLAAQVESLQSWVDRLLPMQEMSPSGDLEWSETNVDDLLPKMLTSQWRGELAEAFKKNHQMRSGKSLRQMVDDPQAWMRCLTEGPSDPGFDLTNPLEAFCRHYVKRWLEEQSLECLISQLDLDPNTVVSAILANVPPRWPQTRGGCDVDTSTIAVGKDLWSIMVQFADGDDPHRIAAVDWQDRHTVAVIRIVQGLFHGWRGFPVLPAQRGSTHSGSGQEPVSSGGRTALK